MYDNIILTSVLKMIFVFLAPSWSRQECQGKYVEKKV